jgi:hypothetical protein
MDMLLLLLLLLLLLGLAGCSRAIAFHLAVQCMQLLQQLRCWKRQLLLLQVLLLVLPWQLLAWHMALPLQQLQLSCSVLLLVLLHICRVGLLQVLLLLVCCVAAGADYAVT